MVNFHIELFGTLWCRARQNLGCIYSGEKNDDDFTENSDDVLLVAIFSSWALRLLFHRAKALVCGAERRADDSNDP